MVSRIRGALSRRLCVLAAGAAASVFAFSASEASAAEAAPEKPGSAYNFSAGSTFTSHFISYGVDVWGGGDQFSPFSSKSTAWGYGTLTANFDSQWSGYVNIWTDLNNNVDSDIGGFLQEIDINTGVTYKFGDSGLSVTGQHGFWCYAGDIEKVVDLWVNYSDNGKWIPNFSLNPSVNLHYRYDGNGAQQTGGAVVPQIAPSFTIGADSDMPLTIGVPLNVAIFTGGFQGGDGGFGYASGGVSASLRLGKIPAKFGLWDLTVGATLFYTDEDAIPSNPEDTFVVTSVDLKVSF